MHNMEDILALIVVFGAIFAVPLVVVLTGHQRKMAQIIHQSQTGGNEAQMAIMQRQIDELRQLVGQQTFILEDLRTRVSSLPSNLPPTLPLS
jgi:HAMP domain-containing protein